MRWMLSRVGKGVGSLFLVGGGTVSTGFLIGITASHASGGVMALLSLLMVMWGIAPASVGGWLLYISSQSERQAIRDRFFHLLQVNQGKLSLLDFAAATRLEPAIARRHLDTWAKECAATFEVSEGGDIYYIFATEPLTLPEPSLEQSLKRFWQSI